MTKLHWLIAVTPGLLISCKPAASGPKKEKEPLRIEWSKDVPAKHDIINGSAITYNDEIYVLAGVEGRFMKYNPATYTWIDLSGLPIPRTEAAMTLWDDRIVIAGGIDDSTNFMRRVDYYDLMDQVWKSMPSLPEARCRFSLNSVNGVLYATVGVCGTNERFYTHCKDILYFDDTLRLWQKQATLTSGRYGNASVVHESDLYLIGGYDLDPQMGTFYINHTRREVGTKANIPYMRGNFGAVTIGDFILTFGGKIQEVNSPTEKYNIKNNKWEILEPCPFWTDRFAYTRWKNTIYVFGGAQFPKQVWKGLIIFKE